MASLPVGLMPAIAATRTQTQRGSACLKTAARDGCGNVCQHKVQASAFDYEACVVNWGAKNQFQRDKRAAGSSASNEKRAAWPINTGS